MKYEFFNKIMKYNNFFLETSESMNMYTAINNALHLAMDKDPSAGNYYQLYLKKKKKNVRE